MNDRQQIFIHHHEIIPVTFLILSSFSVIHADWFGVEISVNLHAVMI